MPPHSKIREPREREPVSQSESSSEPCGRGVILRSFRSAARELFTRAEEL
jgi:hypothetical protein